jgi:hypothetical protein
MEVQAMLQIGNNESQIYTKQYNVVNLHCHFSRHTGNSRPDTDACCERIDITLVAPGMNDVSLYNWYISGNPLSGKVSFDLTNGLGNAKQSDSDLTFDDAYCFAIEEDYHIDKHLRRTVKLSIVADKVTFEGATFKNPYEE